MAALTIMVAALMLAVGGFMFMQKNQLQQITQDEVDLETHRAVARLQHEMRLSSLSEMVFYPSTAKKYTAISFPIAHTDEEGNFPLNSEGKIDWNATVVYHAHGTGDQLKLLRTKFAQRDNTLSTSERQNQLDKVVIDGHGSGAPNGENATTSILFERVFNWEIVPQGSSYDGYSSLSKLDRKASLGSFNLTPGLHTLKLTTTGKDSRSSGYTMGFDTLRISSAGLHREAEAQPSSSSSTFNIVEDPSGMSSGDHRLIIEAQESGKSVSLNFYNDRWEDTNFNLSGATKSNTTVGAIDTSYTPSDFTLKLVGNTTNWSAKAQSWDGNLTDDTGGGGRNCQLSDFYKGVIVRVLLRGQDMEAKGLTVNPFDHDSAGCKIAFRSSALSPSGKDLLILRAYIDTCASTNITPHTQGNPRQITFNSGSGGCLVANGSTLWSDPIDFPLSWEKSYAVTFWIANGVGEYIYPYLWQDTNLVTSTYLIPHTEANTTHLTAANWSSSSITNLPYIVAVDRVYATYAKEGIYTSPPVDTLMEKPEFESVDWTEDTPTGTQIEIRVRSGSTPDMADAKDWSAVNPVPSPGSLTSISYARYLQYQVLLKSSAKGIDTPKLRNISFQWPGETRAANIGGIFVNGPGYGQFEATIDDQPLASPLRISLELQQSVKGFNNTTEIITSESTFELNPRNNGR